MPDPSLVRFRAVVHGALAHLESRRQEINDLNVFPVADGDTGDNMALTLQAVLEEVETLAAIDDRTLDEIGRSEVYDRIARAALLGARGNSGVILSQLVRGAAEELISRPGELIDPIMISSAMANAAQRAYASVRMPAEGTMLTVMREMAAAAATALKDVDNPRLGGEWSAELQNQLIAEVLEHAIEAGEASVKRGPELLPVLREAGVVDAGGYAVTIIFAGVVAALRGGEAPDLDHYAPARSGARVSHPEHHSATYRYCTNFAVTGDGLESQRFVGLLEAIGDSVLCVGDEHTLKVHVHTDDPGTATAVFDGQGEVSRLDVADMHAQVQQRDARLSEPEPTPGQRTGALAVVSSAGLADLFEGLGVQPLDGGPTMNPSTYDLLAGIHGVHAEEVVVLPNSANVIMAAERAADLSDKTVRVLPVRTVQAGLAAALALIPGRDAEANAVAMLAAAGGIRTAAVAPAAREDPAGRYGIGDAVGFVDDELVAWGSPLETLGEVLTALAADAELITCIAGQGAPLSEDTVRSLVDGEVELEVKTGGQPAYWWLLSSE
ncbi:MAG: domain fusion protein YloV [Solirubrobacterales bacterium]|jgi:DAK2 domain fusion protein YloV|nr:domain fusion protein YloV [Solirubrobacterales bacterium]